MTPPIRNWNTLSVALEDRHPREILEWVAQSSVPRRIALGTGFGRAGVCLIDMLAKISNDISIFYLDTGFLFPETYALRDHLEEKYGLKFTRYASDLTPAEQQERYGGNLWETDPGTCCNIRKVHPLKEALSHYDVWITAIRRDQSATRANVGMIEWEPKFDVIKVNPLAKWTSRDVQKYITEHDVPYNTLHDQGFFSIGCLHCTSRVGAGEDERAGRWRDKDKAECGLHLPTMGDLPPKNRATKIPDRQRTR